MRNLAPWRTSANLFGRLFVPGLVLLLALAAAWWPPARWSLVLWLPLLAIALYDFLQRHHTLWRNYPLAGRIRWGMETLRPYFRSYFVEADLEGRPFNHDERALVYARAKGELDAHPFGTELDVYSTEYEWLGHSIVPNEQAPEQWRCEVGSSQCTARYSASLLNISAMSFGSLSANAIMALNKGAALGNFYHDTGEGGLSRYHRSHGGDLVWEIGSGYFGCRDGWGKFDPGKFADTAQAPQVKMVEIKLSQGAKPGKGGMLPKEKITEEIAAIRGIPMGLDCHSPNRFEEFDDAPSLLDFIDRVRKLTGKPIGLKMVVGSTAEIDELCREIRKRGDGPDFIAVDGN